MVDFNKKIFNTDKFRQAALFFQKHGSYTLAPRGTTDYVQYWDLETLRCLYGYVAPDGDSITGYHYFYLNYFPILRLVKNTYTDRYGRIREKRIRTTEFADFYDYDYYYFNAIEEAEDNAHHMAVLKARNKGYEQPYSELVSTPNGFVEMGSLQVNDLVMGPNGVPVKVLEIFEQGYKDVYEIEFADGRTARCGANHLWEIICANNHFKTKVVTTHDLITQSLFNNVNVNGKQYNAYKYYVRDIEPVLFSEKQYNIHPYILGALLGDGTMNRKTPKISTADEEIVNRFQELLGDSYQLNKDNSCYNYLIVDKERFGHKTEFKNGQYGVNRLHRYLQDLDLCVKCDEKYIPNIYKQGSVEQRLELVRGLMDTDGSVMKDGSMEFDNTCKLLIDDFVEVIRSLGITCNIGKYELNDNRGFLYRVYIHGNQDLFHLTRKRNRIKKDRKCNKKVAIVNIKYLGYQEESRCIMVDSEDHLYLTRDFIPTHNSFKGASMLVRNYELVPSSLNFVVASDKKYLLGDGIITKAWAGMDFIDKHTAWAKQRLIDTLLQRKAGFKITDEFGKQTDDGYLSSIIGITAKSNPDAVRGTRGKLLLFEEAGKFNGILDAWSMARQSMEEGDTQVGVMIAFGTGGSSDSDFDGLKELFYHPTGYNIMPFDNIWDEKALGTNCGFFIPAWSNISSVDIETGLRIYMDADGNSLREKAILFEIEERNKVREGASKDLAIDRFVAENPLTPQEACLEIGGNIFPKKLLMLQLSRIRTNEKLKNMKHIVDLSWDGNGKVIATEKKTGDITEYPLGKDRKPDGSVVIWEYPIKDPPYGLYIAGMDPYDHDDSFTNSLGSMFVYKRFKSGEAWTDVIVAEYSGRPATAEEYYENARKLLLLYNAKLLFENERKGIYPYFTNKHCDYLLADLPDKVISEVFKDSKVQRRKGCHMTKLIRQYGEGLIKEWLEEEYEQGHPNLERIYSEPLLEELIYDNGVRNVDRVIALCMTMIYREELYEIKIKESKDNNKLVELFDLPLFGNSWWDDNTGAQDDIPTFTF